MLIINIEINIDFIIIVFFLNEKFIILYIFFIKDF